MSARRRMFRPARAGNLLDQLVQGLGLGEKLEQYRAFIVWGEVVGPQVAARTAPLRIRSGVLEVRVDQAVWMQQLQLLKPKILTRLNERLGKETIRDIFWRQGSVAELFAREAPVGAPALPPLTPEDAARIEATLAPLTSEELRAPMRRLLSKQARLARLQQRENQSETPAKDT